MKEPVRIAVVDDHTLFRKGLVKLINSLETNYQVTIEASNGDELIEALQQSAELPDLVILDMKMPGRNGFETVSWLNEHYPDFRVLVISMVDSEESILRILKMGVKGYIAKNVEPHILREAIESILKKGFYYTDYFTGRLLHELQKGTGSKGKPIELTDREKEILEWMCTDLSYKEIAVKLNTTVKSIDNYRDSLCRKLNAVTRVGLVLYAIRNQYIQI